MTVAEVEPFRAYLVILVQVLRNAWSSGPPRDAGSRLPRFSRAVRAAVA